MLCTYSSIRVFGGGSVVVGVAVPARRSTRRRSARPPVLGRLGVNAVTTEVSEGTVARRSCGPCWCSWCNWSSSWCCWWRWCPRASPPENRRSRGPRRSPTPTVPARDAGRRTCCSWSLFSSFHGGRGQKEAQLVQLVQLLHVLVLLVEVVPASISSGESTKSRTSKVSDSNCSSS